ncbi:MAG: AAA family ATPase [Bacteroidales bacterium]|nr:AAA family ATPase [Bacteroidales bacterium]
MSTTKMTLASAFETILTKARDSKLSEAMFLSVKRETSFIKRKLKISPVECVILAIMLDGDAVASRREIAHYLDCSVLKVMTLHDDFERLRQRRMIYHTHVHDYNGTRQGYRLCKEVVKAVTYDEPFQPRDPASYTAIEVMRDIHGWLNMTDNDSEYYSTMTLDVRDLLNSTQHLELSKQLMALPLSTAEQVLFLIAAARLIFHHETEISSSMYEDILEESYETYDICNGINNGTGDLAKLGLLENAMNDGMAEPDSFQLTEHAIKTVLKEFHINLATRKAVTPDNVILPEKLTRKELFYNAEEQRQVERLMDLLSPKTFNDVQQRLKDNDMRTGFCVLLHGGPGSGKTELVNQISIATGRAVLVAQVSQLISKWVGDYEKHVTELFDQYEALAAKSALCPILLFNECDAILGKRNEQGDGDAVGKMYHSVQNILLERMEKLNGIMICTSNMPGALDKAFERRFLFSIEFHKPQKETKAKIWRSMLPEIDEKTALALASQYDFSGGQIENVVRRQRVEYVLYGHDISFDSLNRICKEEGYDKKTRGIGFCA